MSAERTTAGGGALILAAGFARRFGSDKRRFKLPDGTTLLVATIRRYAAVFANVVVVIRATDDDLADELLTACPGVRIVRAHDAQLGMAHSLAAGIRAIADQWSWVAVALGDMPWIRTHTLRRLLETFEDRGTSCIVQPGSGDRTGHPVLFDAICFAELTRLSGDTGARPVLERHRDQVLRVAVDDPGIFADLDQPS